jgi:predicted RNase H-like HicB family nuclease
MELAIAIHIEKLPEGVYLATSDELQGLVAEGRTVAETLEIARDVARKLIEARRERDEPKTCARPSGSGSPDQHRPSRRNAGLN